MGIKGRAGSTGDVVRHDVIRAGRRCFLREERIDLVALAEELGIARATVYRWFGNRDRFAGAVLLSLALDTLDQQLRGQRQEGVQLVADVLASAIEVYMAHPAMKAFLQSNPERSLAILTGPDSLVHEGLVERASEMIDEHCPPDPDEGLTARDLAYALVRLGESLCYADLITGRSSDLRLARPLFARLLEG